MGKLLLVIGFLGACGQHTTKQERNVTYNSFSVESEEYSSRTCKDYIFFYIDGTLQGYKSLDYFLMFKTSYESANEIVHNLCTGA